MAITLADFNKIWASTSPLTPYSFSESNYKQGWNFIGSTPPARQMWDFLQKNNDEKMQYLANNYLPLSGGTMSGAIIQTGEYAIKRSVDNANLTICGGSNWNKGAYVLLNGKDRSSDNGMFALVAHDGTTPCALIGKPDKSLKWDNNEITTSKIQTATATALNGTLNFDYIFKNGMVAEVDFEVANLSNLTANAWNALVQLPNEYKPHNSFDFCGINATNSTFLNMKLTSSGEIDAWSNSSTRIRIHLVYICAG